jgi:hypothetical protein
LHEKKRGRRRRRKRERTHPNPPEGREFKGADGVPDGQMVGE